MKSDTALLRRLKNEQCGGAEHVENLEYDKKELSVFEYLSPARLSDETFRGMIDFIKASETDAPMDQVHKALVR